MSNTWTDQQAVDWLHRLVNTEKELPRTPADFNLPRTQALLDHLGNPQRRYPAVVIAGTKGKGSTAAMVEAILRAAGLRTGLYTSPHLHTSRERIQVDRQLILPSERTVGIAQLQLAVARLDPALGTLSIYEAETALALLHFATAAVACAVLEIGMGGRYDAVNAVTPVVSAIASISFDHTQALGTTLEAIAYQKAGIIKPGVPVVTVPQHPDAAAMIAHVAAAQGAPLLVATAAGLTSDRTDSPRPYMTPISPAAVGLAGTFQLENARLASGIAMLLRDDGLLVDAAAHQRGLATVRWPGRLETLRERPRLIADGAHNGDSARKLVESLRTLFPHERRIVILGVSADKDLDAIARALVPDTAILIVTRTDHPRSAPIDTLVAAVQPYVTGQLLVAPDVAAAVTAALQRAHPTDLICATGSLFVAAAARAACGYDAA